MATNTADLFFNIIAKDKTSGVLNSIGGAFQNLGNQIGGELGSVVADMGTSFDRLGESGKHLGLKLAAVGGATAALGLGLQTLASKDQAAQQQLQTAIENTGNSWSDYSTQVDDAIKTGEKFAHTANQTENALQTLTQATGDPAKAVKFLSVVFDLAAAKHEDLQTAADQVAKALNGNAKILKQYGIELDGVGSKTDQAARATEQLGQVVSGQAAASVNTFAGRLEVLRAKAQDAISVLAGPVGQALSNLGSAAGAVGVLIETGIIQKFAKAVVAAEGFRAKLEVIGPAALKIGAATAGVALIAQAFGEAADSAARAEAATQGFLGALQSGDKATAIQTTFDILNQFPDLLSRHPTALFQSIEHSTDVLKDLGVSVADVQKHLSDSDPDWKKYEQHLLDLSDSTGHNGETTRLLADNLDAARTAAQRANGEFGALNQSTTELTTTQGAYNTSLKGSGTYTSIVVSQHKAMDRGITELIGSTEILNDRNTGLTESLAQLSDRNSTASITAGVLAKSNNELSDRNSTLSITTGKLAAANNELTDRNSANAVATKILADRNSTLTLAAGGATKALKEQTDAARIEVGTLTDLYGAIEKTVLSQHDAQDANVAAIQAIKDLGKNHKATAQDVHQAFSTIVQAADSVRDATRNAADKDAAYRGELDKLRDKVAKGSPLRKELDAFIAQLDAAAKTRTANILLNIQNSRSGHGHAPSTYYPPPKTAEGGIVLGPQVRLVGEAGPEAIIPLNKAGAIGGTTIVNVTVNGANPNEVINVIRQYERSNSARWRGAA